MKILITGASGQVGQHLSKALANTPWNFRLFNHDQLDIRFEKSVREAVEAYQPHIVINAAAYTAVDQAEQHTGLAYAINSSGAGYLARAAASVNAVIFHISTDYVFSGNKTEAYRESDEAIPLNIYGASKYAGELAIINANEKHIILRTSWIFSEHRKNFVKNMIHLGQTQEQLTVVTDQFGGPTYAGDIASTILKIATHYYHQNDKLPWGIYHYSGYPCVSWYEFAVEIFRQIPVFNMDTGAKPIIKPISTAEYSTLAKRPLNSGLNCEKIKKVFDVELSDWKSALKNTNWRAHYENN